MDIENFKEAEELMERLNQINDSKKELGELNGSNGRFKITDSETGMCSDIYLEGIKKEILDAIDSVLNDQYDKIVKRLKEI